LVVAEQLSAGVLVLLLLLLLLLLPVLLEVQPAAGSSWQMMTGTWQVADLPNLTRSCGILHWKKSFCFFSLPNMSVTAAVGSNPNPFRWRNRSPGSSSSSSRDLSSRHELACGTHDICTRLLLLPLPLLRLLLPPANAAAAAATRTLLVNLNRWVMAR
jgi:hypothetical protein